MARRQVGTCRAAPGGSQRPSRLLLFAALTTLLAAFPVTGPRADEAGVSSWVPGQYASFAAQPEEPGFDLEMTWYCFSGSAGASRRFLRGRRLLFGLDSTYDAFWLTPTFTPSAKVLGGTLSLSLTGEFAYNRQAGSIQVQPRDTYVKGSQSLTGRGDPAPQVSIAWSEGDNSWMTYIMANVPAGSYDPNRYAAIGIGHWAVDLGGAYTHASKASGLEFSATLGFTYNWENPDTHYKNGVDTHLDLAGSKSITGATSVGLVGYLYRQLTGDNGPGAILGPFYSSVTALGAQVEHNFTAGRTPLEVSLRGYYEFQAENRARGDTVILTLSIPLGRKPHW